VKVEVLIGVEGESLRLLQVVGLGRDDLVAVGVRPELNSRLS